MGYPLENIRTNIVLQCGFQAGLSVFIELTTRV